MRHDRHPDDARTEPPISGPTPEDISEALDGLLTSDPTQTPDVRDVETLQAAGIEFPLTVHDRRILGVSVTRGDPMHGAYRSDDHISYFHVEYADECPAEECWSEVTRFEYNAHHHIAGSLRRYCPRCETEHEREEWG